MISAKSSQSPNSAAPGNASSLAQFADVRGGFLQEITWKDKKISKKLEVTVRTVYNLRQRAFKKIRTYYELHGQGRDP